MLEERLARLDNPTERLTPGFERDANSGAILNNDMGALLRHKQKNRNVKRLDELEKLCRGLQADMKKIQEILGECLNKQA